LQGVWEAADSPWSVRLQALLPEWLPWIRRRFRLSAELERQLLSRSPRSIDSRLAARQRAQRRHLYGRTQPGTLLQQHIPVKTDRWDAREPGFTEMDLVSHSGSAASGRLCACASPALVPPRVAALQRLRDTLDPFVLSQLIQAKLARIFQLRAETRPNPTPRSTVSTGFHRKKKVAKKKEKTIRIGYILKLHDDTPKVTFLFCATGGT